MNSDQKRARKFFFLWRALVIIDQHVPKPPPGDRYGLFAGGLQSIDCCHSVGIGVNNQRQKARISRADWTVRFGYLMM